MYLWISTLTTIGENESQNRFQFFDFRYSKKWFISYFWIVKDDCAGFQDVKALYSRDITGSKSEE